MCNINVCNINENINNVILILIIMCNVMKMIWK